MKQFKFYLMAVAAMFALSFASCSDDDTPELEPEPEETVEKYFDIWVKAGTDEASFRAFISTTKKPRSNGAWKPWSLTWKKKKKKK